MDIPFKTNRVEIKGKGKGGKVKVVKYDRSFLSRIIQNAKAKSFYDDLKNYCLSFERVKSRIGWNAESFTIGSEAVVRFIVRAETLCVLFALSPSAYSQKDYPHLDYSDSKDYRTTPFFVPIRTAAEYKIARRLVGEAFTARCVYTTDFPARTDYVAALPMQKDDALVKKGFIKKSESEMSEADAKKAIAAAIKEEAEEEKELEALNQPKKRAKKASPPPEKLIPEEEKAPAEENAEKEKEADDLADEVEDLEEDAAGEDVIFELAEDGTLIEVYLDRSFTARIIQSKEAKTYYDEIKNYALSFALKSRFLQSRISWGGDRFYLGRTPYFLAKVRGKTLCLFLALDPKGYEERIYHHKDVSDKKSYANTPMMIRVRSDLGLKKAKNLINELLTQAGLTEKEKERTDYVALYPYEETDALIEKKLIKRVERKTSDRALDPDEPEEVIFDLYDDLPEEPETPSLEEPPAREEIEEIIPEDEPEDVEFELVEETAEPSLPEPESAEKEPEPEQAEGEENDPEPTGTEEGGESDDDAEEVSFELVEDAAPLPPIAETGGMEAYAAEGQQGRYVTLRKYIRGFAAKLRQGDGERRSDYAEIKAKLLSYKGVKVSESFSGDTFKKGSKILLKSRIRGKTLCLFYALNTDNYKQTVYRQQYKGDVKAYAATPMMVRVRSEQGLKRALQLVEEMERNYLLQVGELVAPETVRKEYPFEDTAVLAEKGLVKTKLVTVSEYEARELLKKKMK